MMRNIAFLIKESGMGYREVISLPYAVFLSLLKHFRIFQIEQTEEGRKLLMRSGTLYQKEPDWAAIRNSEEYQKVNTTAKSQEE